MEAICDTGVKVNLESYQCGVRIKKKRPEEKPSGTRRFIFVWKIEELTTLSTQENIEQ